ncbi:hypothetical protein GBA65_16565 [Rubrobacter marinus]|uniref:Uncharacterized protein n=1 Tax=Rubrobacter marinus TaxID=2653852 RepID=A0A6G8Q069_9ACTN|nr:hypothetical protein [Rubrobacter marinus]QIN79873.1 hypothetical protein GBA65_16565 [Rubrobacter marinus]
MPFEIRPTSPAGTGEDPRISVLADEDWAGVLALARRHGFDPHGEYEGLMLPAPGESGTLEIAASQGLAVALSEALREETAAHDAGEEDEGISVGPADEPGLRVDWAKARGVGEIAESGSLTVTRLTGP